MERVATETTNGRISRGEFREGASQFLVLIASEKKSVFDELPNQHRQLLKSGIASLPIFCVKSAKVLPSRIFLCTN
jgi:hypothetical protein